MANRKVPSTEGADSRTVRASVSFAEEQYAELEKIAQKQKVSLAWVVREAVESYLTSRNETAFRCADIASERTEKL